jgi:hypothetical protein
VELGKIFKEKSSSSEFHFSFKNSEFLINAKAVNDLK